MTDEYAKQLAADVLDTAREWCRRTGLGDSTEYRVVWMTDGTVEIQDDYLNKLHGPYKVTVIVEPTAVWREITWYDLALITPENPRPEDERPLISLQGVEAVVLSAVAQRWHVKPGTGDAKWNPPVPQEHDVVMVKLQTAGREPASYKMPPDGKVMLLAKGDISAQVVAANHLKEAFPGTEVIES